jgi:hypothetical protein
VRLAAWRAFRIAILTLPLSACPFVLERVPRDVLFVAFYALLDELIAFHAVVDVGLVGAAFFDRFIFRLLRAP